MAELDDKLLAEALDKVDYTLNKAYIGRLKNDYDVVAFEDYAKSKDGIKFCDNIRVLRVNRWIKDAEESIIDCFKNVLGVFAATGGNNVALIIRRTPNNVEMFFAIRSEGNNNNEFSQTSIELLKSSLVGNFNGSHFSIVDFEDNDDNESDDNEYLANLLFSDFGKDESNKENTAKSIATVCGIPSEKSEKFATQGIEKLLEGVVPAKDEESYVLVFLAEPLENDVSKNILNGYEELATMLSPYVSVQNQYLDSKSTAEGSSKSSTLSDTVTEAVTKTHSINVSVGAEIGPIKPNVGYGYSFGRTTGTAKTISETTGTNYLVTTATSEGATFTHKSYPIANLVEKAEKTIKRIQNGQANGLWKYASYVISPSSFITKNVAGYVSAILQGDESYVELPKINEWSSKNSTIPDDEKQRENDNFQQILSYVEHFSHPVFYNRGKDRITVTSTSYVSTSELAAIFAFPKNSVPGLPIVECARFGREPHSLIPEDEKTEDTKFIEIGSTYHMHHRENSRIFLSVDNLTKHTFITGTTGSGKSNSVYKIIEKLCLEENNNVKFLVVEPSKGEYKDEFGGITGVEVYGTNPYKSSNLLQLNPFSFPDDIHVLEHIDRLVEVFNACWTMYAAMPAILKDAVEQAYESCGWNLKRSTNIENKFPTFATLLSVLPKVVDESGYSADTSNDYKGALVTRVRSLTKGIYGRVFEEDTADEKLFNDNTIIDLSRIGSEETKSLIMGILVLKLQEFRMSERLDKSVKNNSGLRHVTILEEAHHLLRKTSSEQLQESSNLQGKSVQMLANAIAEMRTYGEGFIIADQSPGLMDMSVIRNTNTKIILCLPDESDRMLVGKAAGLNDKQIEELAKLERGVAAISQNDWVEPILCEFDKFKNGKPLDNKINFKWDDREEKAICSLLNSAFNVENNNLTGEMPDIIRKWRDKQAFSGNVNVIIDAVLKGKSLNNNEKLCLILGILNFRFKNYDSRDEVITVISKKISDICGGAEIMLLLQQIRELLEHFFTSELSFIEEKEHPERFLKGGKLE